MACGKNCGCSACKKKYGGGCRKRRRPARRGCGGPSGSCKRKVTSLYNRDIRLKRAQLNKELALKKKAMCKQLADLRKANAETLRQYREAQKGSAEAAKKKCQELKKTEREKINAVAGGYVNHNVMLPRGLL